METKYKLFEFNCENIITLLVTANHTRVTYR